MVAKFVDLANHFKICEPVATSLKNTTSIVHSGLKTQLLKGMELQFVCN